MLQRQSKTCVLNWRLYRYNCASLSATDIIGPTPPFFGRIDRRFRWQLLARTPDPARLLADFPLPAGCQLDIDPVSTL